MNREPSQHSIVKSPAALPHIACTASTSSPTRRIVRVGYCIDSFDVGGTELNAVRTLEALDRQRFQVTVFHLHERGPLRARYEALGIPLIHLPIGPLCSLRTLAQGARLLRLLRRDEIQVVHTHDLYTNIFAAPWARLGGCRIIASRRWLYEAPRRGLVPLNRWSYRLAHRVVTNSTRGVRTLVDEERVPAARVLELPNFVEQGAFGHVAPEARIARRLGWGVPPSAFLVGAVARLAPVKNHELLLRALAVLGDDVHLVLIGDGPSRGALEYLAATLNISPRVHFTGQLVEPMNLHQFFDVTVLCSRSEGFPNSVIEALAACCPVIATPVGGVPEVIVNRRTGLLVPVDEPETLAACLEELRHDPGLCNRVTQAGLACVRDRYHQRVVVARLESLYAALALEGKSGLPA